MKTLKNKSWKIRYFASYLLIGLVPIIVFGLLLQIYSRTAMHKEVRTNHYSALTQAISKMDYLQEEMNNIAYHLSDYRYSNNLDYENFRNFTAVDESLIAQRLLKYEEMLSVDVQMFLFVRGDENIYTDDGKKHYSQFEHDMLPKGNLTRSHFYTTISSVQQEVSFKMKSSLTEEIEQKPCTTFIYPIPCMDVLPTATIGFMQSDEVLRNVFENYLGAINGNLYIYNNYLSEIYTSEKIELPNGLAQTFAGMKGIGVFEKTVNGEKLVLMRGVSKASGLSFVVAAKAVNFYDRIYTIQNIIILVMAVQLALGIFLAWILSRKSYRPINKLMSAIHGSGKELGGDEFEYLTDNWIDISSKNQALNSELNRQKPLVVDAFLSNVLRGKCVDGQGTISLHSSMVSFKNPYFFVILISALDTSFAGKSLINQQLCHIISNAENTLQPLCSMYSLELVTERRVAVVVNCSVERTEDADVRQFVAEKLAVLFADEDVPHVQMSIGRLYDSVAKVNESFMEALVVLTDYAAGNKTMIMMFEEAVESERGNYQYPVIEQSLYIQSLKHADKIVALHALDEMIQKIAEIDSVLFIQCLCYDIINVMIKTFTQFNGEVKTQDLKAICTFSSLDEFAVRAKELTILICDQQEQYKEEKNVRLKSDLICYVNEHYCDPQLSLESMAASFGLSSNYLSRFFKQETGYNFIQYVSYLRLEWVKEQLIKTDRQIKDIVVDVGYVDVASFARKFKASEGLTPGQYRELMRQQGTLNQQ